MSARGLWSIWGVSTVALCVYFALELRGGDARLYLPGATTDGHYQIELACETCHASPFAGPAAVQAACEGCHLAALEAARDSHPQAKFTDPRNADRVALLDARYCVTCHVEHRPERTRAMGVTLPEDYCGVCHAATPAERPTHAGLSFATCGSAGCHNFHDNRALYEDFLLRHADAPALLSSPELPARNFASVAAQLEGYPRTAYPLTTLDVADADAPDAARAPARLLADWAETAHAANGVNCTACHAPGGRESGQWLDRPGYDVCGSCHTDERARFVAGRHGMRLDAASLGRPLAPLTPAAARLPMKPSARSARLDCGACHGAHRFDTAYAAVEACVGCHDDEHSNAYFESPHYGLVERARAGVVAPGAAVTCATCHLPRTERSYDWGAYVHVLVEHNQSDNLRPNEKMIRTVCMACHGLAFSIDALADRALIRANFAGSPAVHVPSIDFAQARRRAVDRRDATPSGETSR